MVAKDSISRGALAWARLCEDAGRPGLAMSITNNKSPMWHIPKGGILDPTQARPNKEEENVSYPVLLKNSSILR